MEAKVCFYEIEDKVGGLTIVELSDSIVQRSHRGRLDRFSTIDRCRFNRRSRALLRYRGFFKFFLDGLEDDLLAEKLEEAGIPRAAYDEDVARVRRFIPGPVRRTAARIPGAVRMAADAVAQSGLQPRLRSWLDRA